MKRASNPAITCIFIYILCICSPIQLFAQKQKINQSKLWYAYFNHIRFSNNYRLLTDVQERHFIAPVGAQGNLIFRSIVYKNLGNNWEVGAGLGLFFSGPSRIPAANTLIIPEIRPTIDFIHREKAGALNINQRYRFEARYFHHVENNLLVDGFGFGNFRLRYQLSFDYPIIKDAKKKTIITARIYDEIFLNAGNKIVANTFDQNRIYAGLACNLNTSFTLELGYLNWFQETSDGKSYFNRNIYRIGVNQLIDLSKKKNATQ